MFEFMRAHRPFVYAISVVIVAAVAFVLGRSTGDHVRLQADPAAPSASTATSVNVTDEALGLMAIAVEPAVTGSLSAEINAPGSVSAAVNREAIVTPHAAGTVTRVSKRLGESVAAGETLALVTSRDAAALAAERRAAESKAALARSVAQREKELFEQRVTPRQDLEAAQSQADAAEAEVARARIAAESAHVSADGRALAVVSPIAGRITSARAALGAYVEPDAELFRVADPRVVVVEASVPAADAVRVHAGDPAEVVLASGAKLAASVTTITPTVNSQTGAATATLALAEGQSPPVPGEFVRVRIMPKAAVGNDVIVADEAIQSLDGRDVVFIRAEKGFRIQPVTVSARGGGRAAIRSGLHAGDSVATRNAFLLKAEVSKGGEEEQ